MQMIDVSNYKRIAISGTHGIGKTTLVNRINAQLNMPKIPEFARELITVSDFEWQKNTNLENILLLETAILYSHLFCVSTMETFVSDRSILDIYAYICYHVRRNIGSPPIEKLLKKIERMFVNLGLYYDIILFYNKGYAFTLTEDQIEIKEILDGLINIVKNTTNIPIVEINRGDQLIMTIDQELVAI